MDFSIKSICKLSSDTVRVVVTMDAKAWHKARKAYGAASLGCLYGVDISNAVHRAYGVAAQNPTVNDSARAEDGIKTLILFYHDPLWVAAPDNVIQVDFVARKRVA